MAKKKKDFSIPFSDEAADKLKSMAKSLRIPETDVVRNALALYELVAEKLCCDAKDLAIVEIKNAGSIELIHVPGVNTNKKWPAE